MTTLRKRQRLERERRILGAAVEMFRDQGYRGVRMEDLAARADLSVGTLYNYYRTKGDLLIAVVTMEVEEVLAIGEGIVAEAPPDAETAILALVHCYYDHSLEYLSKEMWRMAMALSIEAPNTPNGRRYVKLDARLSDQCARLVGVLIREGRIADGIDPEAFGALIFDALNMNFVDFVRREGETVAELKSRAAAQIGPLARLMSSRP